MTYGSLFSGAGLGDFGFELAGFDLRWQVEIDNYCQKILNLRWPNVPKYRDIKTIKPEELEPVDLITGGFPCQPFSFAGKRNGKDDNRNLWPEMFRVIKAVRPRWVVAENVPGIIDLYLDNVLSDLESAGYTFWPVVFSSHSLGARHKRERLWIVCYTEHYGQFTSQDTRSIRKGSNDSKAGEKQTSELKGSNKQLPSLANPELCGCIHGQVKEQSAIGRVDAFGKFEPSGEVMADTNTERMEGCKKTRNFSGKREKFNQQFSRCNPFRNYWSTEPSVGRVVNGCPNRVDRLKALGNGQTPCSTFLIGELIKQFQPER